MTNSPSGNFIFARQTTCCRALGSNHETQHFDDRQYAWECRVVFLAKHIAISKGKGIPGSTMFCDDPYNLLSGIVLLFLQHFSQQHLTFPLL